MINYIMTHIWYIMVTWKINSNIFFKNIIYGILYYTYKKNKIIFNKENNITLFTYNKYIFI